MAVVVRNETTDPFYFGSGSSRRALPPGEVETISEEEWAAVPFAKRGSGAVNAIWPSQPSAVAQKFEIEHYVTNGVYEPRYIGSSMQDASDTDPVWTIKRLSHTSIGPTTNAVTQIQVLTGVKWSDRTTLPWS